MLKKCLKFYALFFLEKHYFVGIVHLFDLNYKIGVLIKKTFIVKAKQLFFSSSILEKTPGWQSGIHCWSFSTLIVTNREVTNKLTLI
jgi:hypothetical protein